MVNRLKLNEKNVREAENLGRDYQIFDTDVRGFSITIYPSGNRAFTLDYRVGGRQRRMTIGRWPEWTTVAARERAKDLRREIDEGVDPLNQRENAREAPRISDMTKRYLEEHTPHLAARNAPASLNSGLRLHSGPFGMLSLIWARIYAPCRDERRSAIHGQQAETE